MKDHKDVITTPEPNNFLKNLESTNPATVSLSLAAQIVQKIKQLQKKGVGERI